MTERERTHEDDLEMSEAINVAITELRDAAMDYGARLRSEYATEARRAKARKALAAAHNALIVAIADRVREVRAGKP
ncbi:MAG TPA: hypothetical protein VFK04_13110 [Gemmatimonadaceae bacterium]|nr:hypothetical protein [Gemmatimonadaceae bacterium]